MKRRQVRQVQERRLYQPAVAPGEFLRQCSSPLRHFIPASKAILFFYSSKKILVFPAGREQSSTNIIFSRLIMHFMRIRRPLIKLNILVTFDYYCSITSNYFSVCKMRTFEVRGVYIYSLGFKTGIHLSIYKIVE